MTLDKQIDKISTAKVIYILIIVSTLVFFTGIVALIMAYTMKNNTEDWLQTHYRFQIRTCWIGLTYVFLGIITAPVGLGYMILLFTFIWIIARCTKGLNQLEQELPVKNPESWLFT